jgi:hypothetical protein
MVLGLSLSTFTFLHVLVSLVSIASGFVVVLGLIAGKRLPRWTALFLATTALTSLSGFLFPFKGFTPAIGLGVLSLVLLSVAVIALYRGRLAGAWRGTYIINATLALYFNFFVLIVQLFAKVPALKAIAPTQSAPAFGITQLIVMAIFVSLAVLAFKRFRGEPRDISQIWDSRSTSTN